MEFRGQLYSSEEPGMALNAGEPPGCRLGLDGGLRVGPAGLVLWQAGACGTGCYCQGQVVEQLWCKGQRLQLSSTGRDIHGHNLFPM